MTNPVPGPGDPPGSREASNELEQAPGGPPLPAESSGTRSFGLFRFTFDGRTAPGLFVVGWLAAVIGSLGAFVGLLAGSSTAGAVLFVVGLAVLLPGLLLLGGSQALERRASGLAYAGPSPVLVFAATIVGLYLVVVAVVTPLHLAGARLEGPVLSLLGVILQAVAVIGLIRILVVGPGALSWSEMGLRGSLPAVVRELAAGAVLGLPVVVVTAAVVWALVSVVGSIPESPLPPTGTGAGLAINLLAGAVIAPIYEELLFRGFATTAWARVVPARTAIIRTAVLFALAHVLTQGGGSFQEAAGLAIVGAGSRLPVALALGWLFLRRRSLWAAIGLHAAFNGFLLVIAEASLRG
ncbi:MAG: family intrarane metalloprotease [Chloroflexi bacterium]|nr:family intrarane metalloprotease [Chloroflexota bacterium]